jgi:hypothetical protein
MKTFESKLKIESWDEKPYRELADGSKFSRAEVTLSGPLAGNFESLLFYRTDNTSTYVSLMHLTGTIDGRSGSFVLQGEGTFDGTTAHVETRVVSATGDLAGLTGTAESESTHADYPYMPLTLRYDIG